MEKEKTKELIDKFQKSFDEYHRIFLDSYPLFSTKKYNFGPKELNELSIKCQAYISMLGITAKARMNYIGFCKFFAFDNEIDWYNWSVWIKDNKIDLTLYLSISVRIDTELKRMKVFLEDDM